jgi:hypothetical protein
MLLAAHKFLVSEIVLKNNFPGTLVFAGLGTRSNQHHILRVHQEALHLGLLPLDHVVVDDLNDHVALCDVVLKCKNAHNHHHVEEAALDPLLLLFWGEAVARVVVGVPEQTRTDQQLIVVCDHDNGRLKNQR